ncbi:hypothetical protein LDENG_00133850 [Lucifuga dentata]|nr:hypothetical protein LDENG_00133850 [Lucifuga dentata]
MSLYTVTFSSSSWGGFRGKPGQMGYVIHPMCSGSAPGSPPSWTCPEYLQREMSRRYHNQMPKPPQLAPFNAKEQKFYFEPLRDFRTPYPMSEGEPSHPSKKINFSRLYLRFHSFGHSPKFMIIGEDWNVD